MQHTLGPGSTYLGCQCTARTTLYAVLIMQEEPTICFSGHLSDELKYKYIPDISLSILTLENFQVHCLVLPVFSCIY